METTEINKENHPDWVVCHAAGCGMTAHIDHALGLKNDQKAHWVIDEDYHFCSKECWEQTHDTLNFPIASSIVCGCRECTASHDRYYLGIETYAGGGQSTTFDPDSLGQCDMGSTLRHPSNPTLFITPCKVCERRESSLIPHTRCANIGHMARPLGTECDHCAYDAFIAELVGEN